MATGVADVPLDAAPRAPRSNLIPGVFLSHLAVDGKQQGKGLGRILGVQLMVLDVEVAADRGRRPG